MGRANKQVMKHRDKNKKVELKSRVAAKRQVRAVSMSNYKTHTDKADNTRKSRTLNTRYKKEKKKGRRMNTLLQVFINVRVRFLNGSEYDLIL